MSRPTRSSALWILGCLLILQLAISMSSAELQDCDPSTMPARFNHRCRGYDICSAEDKKVYTRRCPYGTGLNGGNHMCDKRHKCFSSDLEDVIQFEEDEVIIVKVKGETAQLSELKKLGPSSEEPTTCNPAELPKKWYNCKGWTVCLTGKSIVTKYYCPEGTGINPENGECHPDHSCQNVDPLGNSMFTEVEDNNVPEN